jgi:hypothetical protein
VQGFAILSLSLCGGCSLGGGDDKPPGSARGAAKQVAELVARLERATRASDWRRVCDELLTRSARRRAGGKDCPRLLRSTAGKVTGARIELRKVTLHRLEVDAEVRSSARGQPALTDRLRIVPERGRYRIDSLR